MTDNSKLINHFIAAEINCSAGQVEAAVSLLDGGATVPFIARYRKEVTGGLDDSQLRKLEERLTYLRDFCERRDTIHKALVDQGKMSDELSKRLMKASTKSELEDIYAPFRTKVKTRAVIAAENGLAPLADLIMQKSGADAEGLAQAFVTEKVVDVKAALDGARDILSDRFANHPETTAKLRPKVRTTAKIKAKLIPGKEKEGEKFSDYFDHVESLKDAPSHRVLAMLRAKEAGVIEFDVSIDEDAVTESKTVIAKDNNISAPSGFLAKVVDWTWRVKFSNKLSSEMLAELRERAEAEAIQVFVTNLKALLLAAPAGPKVTMGLDPGIRTGVKVAVVDQTGKLLATETVYPFPPRNDVRGAIAALGSLIRKHGVELIAIGNGTASRETDALTAEVLKNLIGNRPQKVIVNEAGASVYSASELASKEFPDLDVSLRGAVSIARRLQDPLAELVKIEPKSIGVGQYQHDVDQHRLAKALAAAVEDAVNAVGVDLNTASPALLAYVAGLSPSLAEAIVRHRDQNGPFKSRADLAKVSRIGEKVFSQCAGFLRINDGVEPLDASAVHPEAYDVARQIVKACGRDLRELMGDQKVLKAVKPEQFVTEAFGLPTIRDIVEELKKPGRDPRPEFKTANLKEGVDDIKDLKEGMRLEGTVTNVTAFGAFVDIGVHQDGLVHISQLSDTFVADPSKVLRAGQIVKVIVTSVDVAQKRIALSMKSNPEIGSDRSSRSSGAHSQHKASLHTKSSSVSVSSNPFAEAFARSNRK